MKKSDLSEEIRKITNETASLASAEALKVAEAAKAKAAEVSTLAIAEALKAATLAATKAADAASAAAAIAASTSKDLEYIKKDISDTKADVKEIKDRLDNKFVVKDDFNVLKIQTEKSAERITILEKTNYENTGKGNVIDPQMSQLFLDVKTLRDTQNTKQGSGDGMKNLWGLIVGGIFLIIGVVSFLINYIQ